ncbi:hypothetical protein MNBD_NITROSPINAE02-1224 [hydrothermal vent metagenome]|uniref:Uncharacterized protein n=1 Tax=hydrothermal vent metagenome TaxID=652676 RepID=A0A3B1C8E5_9ZZZZ
MSAENGKFVFSNGDNELIIKQDGEETSERDRIV